MNILVLNYEFPPLGGGAAPVSRDLAFALSRQGHRVVLLTMGYKGLLEYEKIHGVQVYRLKCLRRNMASCAPWEQYSYLRAVKNFLREHKDLQTYDVCHAHFIVPTGEAAYQIYKKYHIPYVITAHGSDVEGHNQKKSMAVMHCLLRRRWQKITDHAFYIVSPSVYLKKLMRHRHPKGRYAVIPNGIDTKRYKSFADVRCKEKRILVMGRLQPFKNVQMILEAVAEITEKNMNGWVVDILGEGPFREKLEAAVKHLGISETVRFYGWIENNSKEQLDFLKHASIYISASMFENCPMSVIEAVLAGCYPLLSDIPAHRQLISEDEFYFELGNTKKLAEKIKRRIRQGVQEWQYNLDRLDWEVILPQYENLLKEAAGTRL